MLILLHSQYLRFNLFAQENVQKRGEKNAPKKSENMRHFLKKIQSMKTHNIYSFYGRKKEKKSVSVFFFLFLVVVVFIIKYFCIISDLLQSAHVGFFGSLKI